MRKELIRVLTAAGIVAMFTMRTACNHSAPRDQNSSVTDQEAPKVETPAGGGTETTNKRSVPERPPAPENTQMGSAVPPAAADTSRPHGQNAQPQAQTAQSAAPAGQRPSAGTPQ